MTEIVKKQVRALGFSLFSPEEIKKISAAKIVTPELYDVDGYPVDGGLMDLRLGAIEPGVRCRTCGGTLKECLGHSGSIDLARPVIHVKYVPLMELFLKRFCEICGKLLLGEKDLEKYKKIKDRIKRAKDIKKCPHCNAEQEKVRLEKPTSFFAGKKRLFPNEIRERLSRIPDEQLKLVGVNPGTCRPEWAILSLLLVPPVTVRPSITLESGERSEDDLTHKLGDIIRANQRLWENLNAGAPEVIIEDLWDLLQYHVTTFFDNTITRIPPARHRSGQPLKTITERIKGKEGRIRHNLAGKRVNYSSRSVISPDPFLQINEIGVPFDIARVITVAERVNSLNIEKMKKLILSEKYPGANYVIRPDGKRKKITPDLKQEILEELSVGYIVERHLQDNDIVLFNRHPSLHKQSLMAHYVRVLPYRTFRLHPSICVAPFTKVDLASGIKRKIDELKNCWKESELASFDWKNKLIKGTELKKFFGLKPEAYNTKCYKLVTEETGREIIATGDHPFYTNTGIKGLKDIKVGDRLIVRPLDTPEYEERDKIIITKKDIKLENTYIKHSLKVLEELKLIPLNMNDQRIMILARLLGHLFGDGTFILKKHEARLIFRGSKEDLITIQNDIRSLGFEPEKIYIRSYEGEIQTIKGKKLKVIGKGASFEVRNKPLALLFKALNAPNGDKVKNDFSVPKWILKAPVYIKREFIASYFGSELSSPALRQNSETNFRTLRFKLSKIKERISSGLRFINKIKDMLKEFGIKITLISQELGNVRKDGYETISLIANINSNKSYLNLFGRIGYIYSKEKDDKARLAYEYSLLKEREIKKRREAYQIFFNLRKKGFTFKHISKKLNISVGILENWAYRTHNAGLLANFIGFEDFCKKVTRSIEGTGLVLETVNKKQETFCPFVYDITTMEDTHNFFANGFLTKNCHPYNADFDGDEMNIHSPQTEEARSEAIILLEVKHNIISSKNNTNLAGCIADAVSGNYLASQDKLKRDEAIQLLYNSGIETNFSKQVIEGKEIYSSIFPKINFSTKIKSGDENLTIKNGGMVSGVIDQNSLGVEDGKLILALDKEVGRDKTLEILKKVFALGTGYLSRKGFTVSLSDLNVNEKTVEETRKIIKEAEDKTNEIVKAYYDNTLEPIPGKTLEESREIRILKALNEVRTRIGKVVKEEFSKDSSVSIMINSGAGGNILNVTQIACCVGQQALWAKRISIGYTNRTLSFFKEDDLSPKAKGFIYSSYLKGLKPYEFFFGGMTGRDALMDTALRTPKSGYLYRRLANALQDLKVEYDGTVRDASENIVQLKYGDDGLDVSGLHKSKEISPGEAIGIITAQSFGEPSTQMALNVFHFAGVQEMQITLGLPRLIEIFDARKNPSTPLMEVHLENEYNNEKDARVLAEKIKEVMMQEIISEIKINFSDKRIEITADQQAIKSIHTSIEKIADKLNESGFKIKVKGNILHTTDSKLEFKELYKLKEKLKETIISGIEGITQVLVVKRDRDYVILTAGSNLKEILDIKGVNKNKTTTNNIYEIEEVLGIEAARQAIINEVEKVISQQGLDIDKRHIKLIADAMTYKGDIKGVTRMGIISEKTSVLARASFETPIKQFVNASIKGSKDELASVIENIILNQPVPVGTGLPGLLVKVTGPLVKQEGKEKKK